MKRAGLVLEGGANRGVFTSGALDYLMEQDFYIPYVVGTSAGACNAEQSGIKIEKSENFACV